MAELGVFEAIYNCRAIRYFTADPVPDELIAKVLDAAIRAPSGSNRQSWHFVVVTDAAKRKALADLYRQGWSFYTQMPRPEMPADDLRTARDARDAKPVLRAL